MKPGIQCSRSEVVQIIAGHQNKISLYKHIQHTNYKAAIYKRSFEKEPEVASPQNHGWKFYDGLLDIDGMTVPLHQ